LSTTAVAELYFNLPVRRERYE